MLLATKNALVFLFFKHVPCKCTAAALWFSTWPAGDSMVLCFLYTFSNLSCTNAGIFWPSTVVTYTFVFCCFYWHFLSSSLTLPNYESLYFILRFYALWNILLFVHFGFSLLAFFPEERIFGHLSIFLLNDLHCSFLILNMSYLVYKLFSLFRGLFHFISFFSSGQRRFYFS